MIPSPIHKVLSTMRQHGVRCLLMGGQACVLYGAAEFSRDTDFAILAEQENLDLLHRALADLRAETIAVPPLEKRHLDRGHAVHFRCSRPDALGLRIDIMARMRGTEDFATLWMRRTTFELPHGLSVEAMSLPDLVLAKKTQRDKDWPMMRRLLETNYFENRDRQYWLPLRAELEALRRERAEQTSAERRPLPSLAFVLPRILRVLRAKSFPAHKEREDSGKRRMSFAIRARPCAVLPKPFISREEREDLWHTGSDPSVRARHSIFLPARSARNSLPHKERKERKDFEGSEIRGQGSDLGTLA